MATKSKSTMGWYYGFKGEDLIVDKEGQILAWRITTATVDDQGLSLVWSELTGMIVADAGYLGSNWQEAAKDLGLRLLTGVRRL